MSLPISEEKLHRIQARLHRLYGECPRLTDRFLQLFGRYGVGVEKRASKVGWSEKDAILITYADSIIPSTGYPLRALLEFVRRNLKEEITFLHLLPFFPSSSDDGFSVIDYRAVDPAVGTWADIEALGGHFRLAFDLVLNHCSTRSDWFRDFQTGIAPGRHYFIEKDETGDWSQVVRPRTSPLFSDVETRHGSKEVWTTFSPDQVDLDWRNPDVLFEFLDILFLYLSKGAGILRLDAVAFLWKESGSPCLHHPLTHEIVKLFRDVVDLVAPGTLILTETNVPHEENISYFGSSDEAHMVYNFSLPPLLLHGILRGTASHLSRWASELPDPGPDATFLNFTASHDGIGVRPLHGLLDEQELDFLVETIREKGGEVSARSGPGGKVLPYELNITWYSALMEEGDEDGSIARHLLSQSVMMCLRGIPAFYLHSLVASENDHDLYQSTGAKRSLNRGKLTPEKLKKIVDGKSVAGRVFGALAKMLRVRKKEPAFHPSAGQRIHFWGDPFFACERISEDGKTTVLCLHNLSREPAKVGRKELCTILSEGVDRASVFDLLSRKTLRLKRDGLALNPWQTLWLVAVRP